MIAHLDCFSGPGGICTGFHAAGINTIAAIEKVESCVQTYMANHPYVHMIHKDIRDVTKKDVLNAIGSNKIDLVTSGMPCETFSTAGATSRSHYDYRQQLYSEAIRIAKYVNAPLILFENVPAILTKKVEKDSDRLIIDDIKSELKANGYTNYVQVVLKAVDFGVPQTRERFFLLATNRKRIKLAVPSPTCKIPVTVRDAFVGLPIMEANETGKDYEYTGEESGYTLKLKDTTFWKLPQNQRLTYYNSPHHRITTIQRFSLIATGESLYDVFKKFSDEQIADLKNRKIIKDKWYIQRNKRLDENKPSKTVTSHCLDELIHPKQNRALSVRECARLQSFPDCYIFEGPYVVPHKSPVQDKYEQIGDAVPPLLAYAWGKTIQMILNR